MLRHRSHPGRASRRRDTNLQAWLARVGGRPAMKREMDEMTAFVRSLAPARPGA